MPGLMGNTGDRFFFFGVTFHKTIVGGIAAEVLADAFIWKIRTYEINVFLSLSQIDGQPCLMFTVTGQSDKLAGKGLAVFF